MFLGPLELTSDKRALIAATVDELSEHEARHLLEDVLTAETKLHAVAQIFAQKGQDDIANIIRQACLAVRNESNRLNHERQVWKTIRRPEHAA